MKNKIGWALFLSSCQSVEQTDLFVDRFELGSLNNGLFKEAVFRPSC